MKNWTIKTFLAGSALVLSASAQTEEWDLKSLPHYQPRQQVSGTIRMGGASMAGLVVIWEKAFQKIQPGVQFANELPSSDVALAAIITGSADIAPCGREPAIKDFMIQFFI